MLLLLATKEAQFFHQLLLGRGSPADAGPESCTPASSELLAVRFVFLKRVEEPQDIPETVERAPPHLQVLCLIPGPEKAEVGLVPDIDDQAVGHAVGLDVAEEMGQVAVPAGPVAVITGVGGRGILRSVGAP
jgi:hypothetical protein